MKRILTILFCIVISNTLIAQIKVACIGNSITAGPYPSILATDLGNEWEVKNYGVPGATMVKNGDLPYYKQAAWEDAKAYNPDVVIIKLGTNDSKPQNWKYKDEYVIDYNWMISELRKLPSHPYIILCLPVPAYGDGWGIRDSVIKFETIGMVQAVANQNRLKVIDLYKALSNHKEWFPDGIHPDEKGSAEIAGVIAVKLKKWKKKIERRKKG